MKIKNPKKYLFCFFLTWLFGIVAIIGFNAYMDPFQYLRKMSPPYFSSKIRIQNAGLIKNYPYDSVVVGTSRSMNFYRTDIQTIFGWDPLKITMAGSSPHEQFTALEFALKTGKVKRVLWGVDVGVFYSTQVDALKEEFPAPLYSNEETRFLYYLFNMTTLFVSVRNLAFKLGLKTPNDFNIDIAKYNNILLDKSIGELKELRAWYKKRTHSKSLPVKPSKKYLEKNINQNMLSLIQAYPDVIFYILILPYNIMCHLPLEKESLEYQNAAYIDFFRLFSEAVLPQKNVKAFDFLTQKEFVCDFKKYHDTTHFYPFVSKKILEDVSHNHYRLEQDDIPFVIEKFKKMVLDFYDYADQKVKGAL